MSGVVIWCEHECPALSKIAWERMSVGTNVRTPPDLTWMYNLTQIIQGLQQHPFIWAITLKFPGYAE